MPSGVDTQPAPLVAVIMGSTSDWDTMQHTVEVLEQFGVPHERHVVSAHRTPAWMAEFATGAEGRGVEVIIAGAGGAAHLPGMVAAHTVVPVLGVPVQSAALQGLDSLLSIVQMPGGVPVATLAIGKAGATNAGLLAVSILSNSPPGLAREAARVPRRADAEGPTGRAARVPMIAPGAVLGVLGSGQLGRMFTIAARRMGYRVHTYSPDSDTPTGQVADVEVCASYDDADALRAFARKVVGGDVRVRERAQRGHRSAGRVGAGASVAARASRLAAARAREAVSRRRTVFPRCPSRLRPRPRS